MFNRIIVPTDGSDAAWRAVVVGGHLATQCDADLELLYSTEDPAYAGKVERALRERLADEAIGPGTPILTSEVQLDGVARTIARHVEETNGGVVVMSSHGHGRSAAFLGNVATDVLHETFGPVVIVGPHANIDRPNYGGALLVAVDGSPLSETALGLAGAWGTGLGAVPWVTNVIPTIMVDPHDTVESGYPRQLAKYLQGMTHRRVEFEVLHGGDPALAIADFATEIDASLVVASTHGRTGAARFAFGSVAAAIVRRAPCPVVLLRPPALGGRIRSVAVPHAAQHHR